LIEIVSFSYYYIKMLKREAAYDIITEVVTFSCDIYFSLQEYWEIPCNFFMINGRKTITDIKEKQL